VIRNDSARSETSRSGGGRERAVRLRLPAPAGLAVIDSVRLAWPASSLLACTAKSGLIDRPVRAARHWPSVPYRRISRCLTIHISPVVMDQIDGLGGPSAADASLDQVPIPLRHWPLRHPVDPHQPADQRPRTTITHAAALRSRTAILLRGLRREGRRCPAGLSLEWEAGPGIGLPLSILSRRQG